MVIGLKNVALVVVLLVLINLPAAHATATDSTDVGGGLWAITLSANAVVLAMVALLWRFRGHGRREVETVEAISDVSHARPGVVWEVRGDGTALVAGEVLERNDHEVVLDLEDRLVRVVLDGHANPVGYQQSAQVHVRLQPSPMRDNPK